MILSLLAAALLQVPPSDGILLERRLAEELDAAVGDTVLAGPISGEVPARPFVIEGVYERPADPSRISRNEFEVRFHLPDLEAMLPGSDRVDRFAISLRPGADAGAITEWVEGLAFGAQLFDAHALADEASTTFRVVSRFHDAIGGVTLLASGIFLLCLMVIRVDERRSDVRTMRLIGVSRRTILGTVLLEGALVAGTASVAGAILGVIVAGGVNAYYGAYYDTTLRFALVTPRIVWGAIVLGIVLGVGAGGLAALRLVRLPAQRLGER